MTAPPLRAHKDNSQDAVNAFNAQQNLQDAVERENQIGKQKVTDDQCLHAADQVRNTLNRCIKDPDYRRQLEQMQARSLSASLAPRDDNETGR